MIKKNLFNKNGQAIVEFAVVIQVFLLLFMFVVQFMYICACMLLVEHAAFVGARVGIVNTSEVTEAVHRSIPMNLVKDVIVNVRVHEQDQFEGEVCAVNIYYKVPLFFPVVNFVIKKVGRLDSFNLPLVAKYKLPM